MQPYAPELAVVSKNEIKKFCKDKKVMGVSNFFICLFLQATTFKSVPNGSVKERTPRQWLPRVYLIVLDKKLGTDNGEFQIPGDMVAHALENRFDQSTTPQTIFALRVLGASITLYRADFSNEHLKSFINGLPSEDIIIFRSHFPLPPRSDDLGWHSFERYYFYFSIRPLVIIQMFIFFNFFILIF
jgi:hypothetical protein